MNNIEFSEVNIYCDDALLLMKELGDTLMALIGHNGAKHVNLSDFEQEGSVFIIGYLDGQPICCAGIRRDDEKTGEIKRVYARNNKIGAGASLVQEIERWAKAHGYSRLILECRDNNPHAIGFYRKMGYVECEKFPPYINEDDAVCMDKYI